MGKFKTAKTIKEYKIKAFGYTITIPEGSRVSNKVAGGFDDNYHFWQDYSQIASKLTGFKNSSLSHDLKHYGINIPATFCEKY